MAASKQLRRYGPVVIVVALVAVILVVVAVSGGGSDDEATDDGGDSESGGYTFETSYGETVTLPEGVIPFSVAEEEDLDIDWPDTCDVERGQVATPTFFSPECYAPFDGDNGGATDEGVTGDSIKVVLYQGLEDDPIVDAIASAVTPDSPPDVTETYKQYLNYFEDYYETYGRSVDLVVYEGTGNAVDEIAARADAVAIADEIKPFAVWGGPILTSAFADELAAQGILNIGLAGGGEQPEYYESNDPYLFQIGMAPGQSRTHIAEYVGKRLAGRPAEHAGDAALAEQDRKFGLIYIETGPESGVIVDELEEQLAEYDAELVEVASYTNPLDVTAEAPGIIAAMKDAGVTTIIVTGDPLTPATWTRTATELDYYPEWFVGGVGLIDSTIYGRTYDQDQWKNAFGVTFGAARQDPEASSYGSLFRWYACAEPPAADTVELVYPIPSFFFSILQGVGPDLTHENFRDAIWAANPTPRGLTVPTLSWGGPEKGRWDEVDYQGVDDGTEIWWDPDASGLDETGTEGSGMYTFVDGGKRYLPGEWPETDPTVFVDEGAVTIYAEPPEEEVSPDYPSPC